jgi:hypothetical protein
VTVTVTASAGVRTTMSVPVLRDRTFAETNCTVHKRGWQYCAHGGATVCLFVGAKCRDPRQARRPPSSTMRPPDARRPAANYRMFVRMTEILDEDVESHGLSIVPLGRSRLALSREESDRPTRWRSPLTRAERCRVIAAQGRRCGRVECISPGTDLDEENCEIHHAAARFATLTQDILYGVPRDRRNAEIDTFIVGSGLHRCCHKLETKLEREEKCAEDAAEIVRACGLPMESDLTDVLAQGTRVQKHLKEAWWQSAGHKYAVSRRGHLLWTCPAKQCRSLGASKTQKYKGIPTTDDCTTYAWNMSTTLGVPSVTPAVVRPHCLMCYSNHDNREQHQMVATRVDGEPIVTPTRNRRCNKSDFCRQSVQGQVKRQLDRAKKLRCATAMAIQFARAARH